MARSRDNASERPPYRRALAIVVAIGLAAAVASLCVFAVDSADFAIIADFGKPTQVITTPGLGFKYPWQNVRTFDRRCLRFAAERISNDGENASRSVRRHLMARGRSEAIL